jgi:hypothetical protein
MGRAVVTPRRVCVRRAVNPDGMSQIVRRRHPAIGRRRARSGLSNIAGSVFGKMIWDRRWSGLVPTSPPL